VSAFMQAQEKSVEDKIKVLADDGWPNGFDAK
jgi:hypothetical protein